MQFPLFSKYSSPDDGAGAGSGGGSDPGAATPPPTPGVPGQAAGAGTPPPAPTPPPDQRPTFNYAEDRSKWIPPHRFNEVSQRVQLYEQALEQQKARTRALMGIDAPEDPRKAELVKSMKEMFPGLARFIDDPEFVSRLEQGGGRDTGFESAYWDRHAQEMTTDAVSEFAKAAGVKPDDLGPQRMASMARQISAFISADPSGQRKAAYERRDPAFTQELITDLTGVFVAPIRRTTVVQQAGQLGRVQSLPSSRGPSGTPPPAASSAERPKGKALHEAARQALLQATGNG